MVSLQNKAKTKPRMVVPSGDAEPDDDKIIVWLKCKECHEDVEVSGSAYVCASCGDVVHAACSMSTPGVGDSWLCKDCSGSVAGRCVVPLSKIPAVAHPAHVVPCSHPLVLCEDCSGVIPILLLPQWIILVPR